MVNYIPVGSCSRFSLASVTVMPSTAKRCAGNVRLGRARSGYWLSDVKPRPRQSKAKRGEILVRSSKVIQVNVMA